MKHSGELNRKIIKIIIILWIELNRKIIKVIIILWNSMHLKLILKPQQVHSGGLRCDDILKFGMMVICKLELNRKIIIHYYHLKQHVKYKHDKTYPAQVLRWQQQLGGRWREGETLRLPSKKLHSSDSDEYEDPFSKATEDGLVNTQHSGRSGLKLHKAVEVVVVFTGKLL